MRPVRFLPFCFCACLLFAANNDKARGEWPVYGHDPGGQRFSPLTQINSSNVKSLKMAWTFNTDDAYQPKNNRATVFESTPLYVDGTLFVTTPLGRIIALDPVSGKQKWAYDPIINKDAGYGDYTNRGASTWKSPSGQRRIFIATIDARLIAVDAATGKPCADFGDNGIVNLRQGLRIPIRHYSDYEETSPPAIVGNTIIVGSGIADNRAADQPSGEVRGFDVVTGKEKWAWDPIPQDSPTGRPETWKKELTKNIGAANAWSVIAADPTRNLVFIPTGSASPDYFGGKRPGNDLFADSIVALRADTGKMVWYFQTVHHDLWDYDVASPPLLFDIHRNGKTIPAIAVGSKTGNLFLLNRETGKPIFGVEERPVPKSDVPGETSSPTQPFPLKPAPVTPQKISADDAWGPDEASRNWCRAEMGKQRSQGIFTPPSLQGSLSMPGNIGGMAWGGEAFDPVHHLLILPENRLVAEDRLIPRDQFRQRVEQEHRNINGGWEFGDQKGTPYAVMRRFLWSPAGTPCNAPPWGTLLAIDVNTGDKKWEVPIGNFPKGPPNSGSITLGGPIVTAGGLAIMGGTLDPALRAFDVETGRELWKGTLPAAARSTPMTYKGPDGKQYVVISAGGWGVPQSPAIGGYLVAFSLQ